MSAANRSAVNHSERIEFMTRTALVTGGNRGIGAAVAAGLAKAGHRVIVGARNAADGEKAAAKIGAESVGLDLADPASIDAAMETIGSVDILINNAGVLHKRPMIDHPADFDESLAVMLHGPYRLIRACVPAMKADGYGRIVNVSSGWGSFESGLEGPGAYGVAKAALNALTLALSREVPQCIKINAVCPGWVRTRMGGITATRSIDKGAEGILWLAALPDDGPTGGFFRDGQRIGW
jgi:NAD(P)-dependent dehydrogenase (short-subunit alcohol dehydrogenase family)